MTASKYSHWLVVAGLIGMVAGAVDPLEGSPVVAVGSGLVALGAYLGRSRRRGLAFVAFVMVAVGIGAMWALTAIGGVGGSTGRSAWWVTLVAPLVVGWILGLFVAVRVLIDRYRKSRRGGRTHMPGPSVPSGP